MANIQYESELWGQGDSTGDKTFALQASSLDLSLTFI